MSGKGETSGNKLTRQLTSLTHPSRLSRREFLTATATALAGLATHNFANAAAIEAIKKSPATIGSGYYTYQLVEGWGELPKGLKYGWGLGIVADSADHIYVHSRAEHSVIVFDRDGKLLATWGAEFAESGHGLYWSQEEDGEFLYFTDHLSNLVVKTDLKGNVVMRLGKVAKESLTSITSTKFDFNQPTNLAVAPNGDLYVCEGYGGQRIHRFSSDGKLIKSVGSEGSEPLQFKCPHGIWVDTRKVEPEIYVADRSNHRIQVLSLELEFKRFIKDENHLCLPCCFYQFGGKLFIPDLEHRVTVWDELDKAETHLGDSIQTKKDNDRSTLAAPHALCLDSRGDLYVIEWLDYASPRKFRHIPSSIV
jgi:hypothetical protein